MADMQFLDTLDDTQAQIASLIIKKAKEQNINPRLALSLAFRESSLRHGDFDRNKEGKVVFKPITGTSGEVGLMQVMPNTAKQYGFDPKELNSLERNIDIGLHILKANIDRFNDPMLAVAAYNAGENHPFFSDPDKNPLPDTTKQYIKDIQGFGGFTEAEPTEQVEPEGLPIGEKYVEPQPAEPTLKQEIEKRVPAATGAVVGATTGTAMAAGKKAKSAMDLLGQYLEANAGAKPMPITGVTAPSPGMPGALPSMGGQLPPPTGPLSGTPAGGRMTQNWIKAQDTAGNYADIGQRARSMGEAHQMKEAAIQAENKIRQIAPEMRQAPERGGLFLPEQIGAGPRGARTVPINAPMAEPSLLDDAIAKLGNIAKGAANVGLKFVSSAPVAGGLGGYGAVSSAEEAITRGKAGDRPGATLAGLGTLQALAAIPTPATRGVGLAAGIVSPLGLAIMDRVRKVQQEPTIQPSAAEMEAARKPAFIYPNP